MDMDSYNNSLLDIRNLFISFNIDFGKIRAVNGLDLLVNRGDTLGLIGESGSGKSVTALSVMKLLGKNVIVSANRLYFNGKNILNINENEMRKIRGKKISIIFQNPTTSLNPTLKVVFQIAESFMFHQGMSKTIASVMAHKMLELVGIPDSKRRGDCYPFELSGGMQQRIMIAIALACHPLLLICDEPTTALDVTIQAQILELIRNLKKEIGTSILLITHDFGVVAEMCNRVVVIYAGHAVETGLVEDIFDYPLHPYTQGLLKAVPRIDESVKKLEEIAGPPLIQNVNIQGCPFCPRCPVSMNKCCEQKPLTKNIGKMHTVACFQYTKLNSFCE